ncbi:MAG: aldehyde dehydrogenase family protein [Gammaproteobacteria bacterium]|nr:aldehyde dehydrogenase family protein [Gammaproteobacteria bacterium]
MNMLEVRSPYSDEVIGEVPLTDADGIEHALQLAHGVYRDKSAWLPLHERVAVLEKLAGLMADRREQLALQAAQEGGKPLKDSLVETDRAIDGVKICIEVIRHDHGAVIPMGTTAASAGHRAFTQREPIGVVAAVSAFNHPLNLIVHQVATAVAAGCPVLVKPASSTPLSAWSVDQMLHEAGLPEAWCQFVLPPDNDLVERMVTDERVAFLTFIGSEKVGWMLRSKLAPGTRCALEHGGVAPLFVAADADLDAVVAAITKGGYYHAGQVCVSVQRVYAEQSVAQQLAERIADSAKQLQVGDPADASTDVGPLIRPGEVERVHAWVQEAVKQGADLRCGGEALPHQCYAPTLLYNPPADARVSREEIFGPVVCVYPYADLDDAIAQANSVPYAFQAAVYTDSLHIAEQVFAGVDAAAVMVNQHTAFRVDGMPFAGLKRSGYGIGGMPYTIADMQIEKMLVWNAGA